MKFRLQGEIHFDAKDYADAARQLAIYFEELAVEYEADGDVKPFERLSWFRGVMTLNPYVDNRWRLLGAVEIDEFQKGRHAVHDEGDGHSGSGDQERQGLHIHRGG